MSDKDVFVKKEDVKVFVPAPKKVLEEGAEGIYLVVISDVRGGNPDPFFTIYWQPCHEELEKGWQKKPHWSTMFNSSDVDVKKNIKDKWNNIKQLIEEQLK